MKSIVSAFLWSIGGMYFLVLFCITALGMILFSSKKIYPMVRILARIQLLIMGVRVRITGIEHIDKKHSYIVMGNHESLFDIFALPTALPMHGVGVEAAHHFEFPLWGYLTRKWGNIPIPRKKRDLAIQALHRARGVIRSGTSIIILPEGHRTLDGKIRAFKKGPFYLAKESGADILPFAFTGLYEFKSKNSWLLRPGPVTFIFGKPIPHESFHDMPVDELKEYVRKIIMGLKSECRNQGDHV